MGESSSLQSASAITLPRKLFTGSQSRALDQQAMASGIAGFDLMQRAGRSAFRRLLQHWPRLSALTVICGGGNNGGDGYVVAGLASLRGLSVQLRWLVDPGKLVGDARKAWQWSLDQGVVPAPWEPSETLTGDVVVDAMLGTGLSGPVRAPYDQAIRLVNDTGRPVLAIDLPSGLHSDTGSCLGTAVRARVTVTFIGCKQGLLTGAGPGVCGRLYYDDLGVADETLATVSPGCTRIDLAVTRALLPQRQSSAHKGDFGKVMVIGGERGMGGAPLMAAEAACRAGAGLVYAATRPEHLAGFLARRPEVMVQGVSSGQAVIPLLAGKDVLVLGPGLGQSAWSEQMCQAVMANQGSRWVIDADGINLLARHPHWWPQCQANWILTPHPGEAARLLECTTEAIETDRFAAVAAMQSRYGGCVVLKGAGTLIAWESRGKQQIALANTGNPGMATGGMGDVLSGIIGGLLAQGLSLENAAKLGVCLHGDAADQIVKRTGEAGLLPTDLISQLACNGSVAGES